MPGKDFKKELKALYSGKRGRIDEVDVPRLTYLALDGRGDPSTAFGPALGALYAVGFPLKFAIKARDPSLDYVIMPPEALYTAKDPRVYGGPREKWPWTALLLQPVKPRRAELDAAKARAVAKGAPGADRVRLETIEEGSCVQTLHVGPYEREHEAIAAMHTYMEAHGYTARAPHHEIYMSDPHRVAPEKIKTILRQPVAPVAKKAAIKRGPALARTR